MKIHRLNSYCFLAILCFLSSQGSSQDIEIFKRISSLVFESEIQKELSLTNKQSEEIRVEIRKIQTDFRSILRSRALYSDKAALTKKAVEISEDGHKALSEILLPFQIRRLFELSHQLGAVGELPSGGLKGSNIDLDLSAVQKSKIDNLDRETERKIKELHKRYRAEMQVLLEEVNDEVEDILEPNQFRKYRSTFGKPHYLVLEKFLSSELILAREYSRQVLEAAQKRKHEPK